MILTCPECATSYFVDDSRVPTSGRAVKCSHCGAKWTALPDAAGAAAAEAAPAPAAAPRADLPATEDIAFEAEPETDLGAAPIAAPIARRRRPEPPPKRQGGSALVWVVAAAVVVGLVGGLLVFRSEVARLAPATRGVYAKVGLPANPLGLVIEGVRADAAFQGGRPMLAVTGQIRNVRTSSATAPRVRVSLLDKAGKPLAAKVAQPIDGRVPAGQVRHFAIAIVDPPANVHDLQVTFEEPVRGAPKGAPPPRAAEARVAGPQPVDARPLPPGSPDALPPHD
jgi:predicted Zn finger-like uncharacterized protein